MYISLERMTNPVYFYFDSIIMEPLTWVHMITVIAAKKLYIERLSMNDRSAHNA